MTTPLNSTDDLTRRRFVARAASSLLGVGLLPASLELLNTRAFAAEPKPLRTGAAKNVIYLYMTGGMSHLDTFDVKPGAETQGPTGAIKTSADGVRISEFLPLTAGVMHHGVILNSLSSTQGAHEQGNYYAHTSYTKRGTIKHPSMGAWLTKLAGKTNATLPGHAVIGDGSKHPGCGFFESSFAPLLLNKPEAGLPHSGLMPGMTSEDLDFRLGLSNQLDGWFRNRYQYKNVGAYTQVYEDAVKLMRSADLAAFDLSKESDATKSDYGLDTFGQGCLLARRLVEHGIRFVEVTLGGWDTHTDNFTRVEDNCDKLDKALSALVTDLEKRGMLEETLIVLTSEFGRSPDINGNTGRDHYPKAYSSVLWGGGVKGGQTYGKTDEKGASVIENKVTIPDLNATIAYALGLPLDPIVYSPSKRPFTVADKGNPVTAIF